jgi:hypothetical protein
MDIFRNLKLGVIAVLLCMATYISAKIVETYELQGLINISEQGKNMGWDFVMFTGEELTSDFFAARPFGGYEYVTSQFYPADTVDVNSNDYTIDKHGNPLTEENSLGTFYNIGSFVDHFDFNVPPEKGSVFEIGDITFDFKNHCGKRSKKRNQLFTKFLFRAGSGKIAVTGDGIDINGTGCNEGQWD